MCVSPGNSWVCLPHHFHNRDLFEDYCLRFGDAPERVRAERLEHAGFRHCRHWVSSVVVASGYWYWVRRSNSGSRCVSKKNFHSHPTPESFARGTPASSCSTATYSKVDFIQMDWLSTQVRLSLLISDTFPRKPSSHQVLSFEFGDWDLRFGSSWTDALSRPSDGGSQR